MPLCINHWMTHSCLSKSFKSEALPHIVKEGLTCAPLQTFTEEELMIKESGNVSSVIEQIQILSAKSSINLAGFPLVIYYFYNCSTFFVLIQQ